MTAREKRNKYAREYSSMRLEWARDHQSCVFCHKTDERTKVGKAMCEQCASSRWKRRKQTVVDF